MTAKSTSANDPEFATRAPAHGSGGNGKVAHLSVGGACGAGESSTRGGAAGCAW